MALKNVVHLIPVTTALSELVLASVELIDHILNQIKATVQCWSRLRVDEEGQEG